MKTYQYALAIIGGIFALLLIIGAIMYMARQLSLAVTSVDVIEVEPGVRCARMVTADGAAISCWWNDPCDQYETQSGRTGQHGAPTHWMLRPSSALLLSASQSGKGE